MSERFRKIKMIRKREIEEKSEKLENGEAGNQTWLWKAWRTGEASDSTNLEIQTQKPTILEFKRD